MITSHVCIQDPTPQARSENPSLWDIDFLFSGFVVRSAPVKCPHSHGLPGAHTLHISTSSFQCCPLATKAKQRTIMMHMLLFLDFLITFFYFWTESIMKRCMLLKNAHAVTFLLSSVRATLKRKKKPHCIKWKKNYPQSKKNIYTHWHDVFSQNQAYVALTQRLQMVIFPKKWLKLDFFLSLYERYACFWNYSPPWRTENTFLRFTLKGGEGEGGRQRTALWLAIAEPSKEKQSERRTDDRHQFDVAIV